MRTPAVVLLVVSSAMALAASGCRSDPPYRAENDPGAGGPTALSIHEKADRFERLLEERHVSPDGLLLYRVRLKDPAFLAGQPYYEDYADQAIWGGCLLAAECFRFAVTGSDEARAAAVKAFGGIDLILSVSGEPGLAVRSVAPAAAIAAHPEPDPTAKWEPAAPPWERFVYRGNVSKDQYAGLVFGLAVAWRHLAPHEPEVAARIRHHAGAIVDRLLRDRMILTERGEPTRFGNVRGRILGAPIGVNALIALGAFRLAHDATGDPRHVRAYRRMIVDGGYDEIAYWARAALPSLGLENHNNDNMAYLGFYATMTLERDPEVIAELRAGLRRAWIDDLRAHDNPFWTFIHVSLVEDDDEAVAAAVEQLRRYPERLVARPVDLRRRSDIPRRWFRSRKGVPRSAVALPMDLRTPSTFAWRSCPFALYDDIGMPPDTLAYSGVDYVLAYWLGRHHGLIPPPGD